MKKNIIILTLLLSGLCAWGQETTSYITLGAAPFQNSYSISPIRGNRPPIKADVKFTYDQTEEVVTLQMIIRSGEYTHVLIPPKQDTCLLRYAKDFSLFRTTHPFRKGLDRKNARKGITCSNSRLVDVTNCGLYAVDDTILVRFYLNNQNVDTFFVDINNIIPIIDKKSFFGIGKVKHNYIYFGSPLKWEITIQRDPCIMKHNIIMKKRIENLCNRANKVEKHLKESDFKKGCELYKNEFVPALRDTLNELKKELEKIDKHLLCETLKEELNDIEPKITSLENFKCTPDSGGGEEDSIITEVEASARLKDALNEMKDAYTDTNTDYEKKISDIINKNKIYRQVFNSNPSRIKNEKFRKTVEEFDKIATKPGK